MTKPNWRKWEDEEPLKDKGQVLVMDSLLIKDIKDKDIYSAKYIQGMWYHARILHKTIEAYMVNITASSTSYLWCYADEVFGEDE